MSQSADNEALTAWADALRNGLGRVRFGDLPDAEFERILEAVPADDVDTLVVFAENASMAGLASMESSGPLVPRVRRAISARRAKLVESSRKTVVEFHLNSTSDVASNPKAQHPARGVKALAMKLVSLFAEPASGYDSVETEESTQSEATAHSRSS